jgi:hypothetical protein
MRRAPIGIALAAAGLLTLTLGLAPEARAQDAGNQGSFWRASAYLWWANIDGINYVDDVAITVGDTTSLHASFAGDVQVGKGRFRGIGRFSTTTLKNQGTIEGVGVPDGAQVNYDFSWTTAELLAAWQVGRFESAHAFKLYGGLRYVHQGQKLLDGPQPGEVTQDWVEPVFGAEYFVEMGGPFWAAVDGDMGGVLFGSEIAWRVGAELGINVAGPVHLTLAYDYLQTQYGTTDSDYRWDEGVSQGWFFGLVIKD